MGADREMDGENKEDPKFAQQRLVGEKKEIPKMAQLKLDARDQQPQKVAARPPDSPHVDGLCQESVPHMLASASSPSLLMGCGDQSTPSGSSIGRHIHSHVHPNFQPLSPQILDPSPHISFPTSPASGDPPDSIYLSPASGGPPDLIVLNPLPRRRQERPISAPPHELEKISGTLLRLVGDHYLCCTCGRQLRNIGDQLTFETNLHHVLSSGDLNLPQNG